MNKDLNRTLLEIEEEIKKCNKCELSKLKTNAVPGEGGFQKRIMLIGEAPGRNEDLQGKPFVGRAGKILDELLKEADLTREDIFITNVVKCRPPGNRDPLPNEIKACSPFLEKQIQAMQPKIIITLGRFAMNYIFEKYGIQKSSISQVHGKTFKISSLNGLIKIIPMLHPAVVAYDSSKKQELVNDFKKLKEELR